MNLLALDLGTKTGYALALGSGLQAGTWVLSSPADVSRARQKRLDRRQDPRINILWDALTRVNFNDRLDWIFFEDVQFATTTMQCQLWSSFRTVLWLFAYANDIKIDCCPVGTLKKFATGHGGADKAFMRQAFIDNQYLRDARKLDNFEKLDDNAIDALHLLNWGKNLTSRL